MSLKNALLLALLCSISTLAFAETEPNNSFATANWVNQNATMTGANTPISGTSDDDYFVSLPSDDGTVSLALNYTSGLSTSDIFLYMYNSNGAILKSDLFYDVPAGIPQQKAVNLYCFAQDTIYFRIITRGSMSYSFSYNTIPYGIGDIEPNDNFPSAQWINHSTNVNGRIGYRNTLTDGNDYFETLLPDDGTIELIVNYNNTSNAPTSDFFTYVYNSNGSIIGSSINYDEPLGVTSDTLLIYCRAVDTTFFRFTSSGCFSYNFSYRIIAPTPTDMEPNNTFGLAQGIQHNTLVNGRIGYSGFATDNNDYFKSELPDDGTIELIVNYNNTSNATTSDFFTYVYDSNGSIIGNSINYDEPLGVTSDTLLIYCRAIDSTFFRFTSAGCFSYNFKYRMISTTPTDVEPNNSTSDAQWINHNIQTNGRIGYAGPAVDNNDYFKSVLPDDGTIELIVNYNNTSNSASSDFFTYVYNSNGSIIGSSINYDEPLGVTSDTLLIYCRAVDTTYFRFTSTGCFSYNFKYRMIDTHTGDVEPNNALATAQVISFDTPISGTAGHAGATADNEDYFKLNVPANGNIQLIANSTNTSNSTGSDLFYQFYSSTGALLKSLFKYDEPLGMVMDTIDLSCITTDELYLRISSTGCFNYDFTLNHESQEPEVKIDFARFGNDFAFASDRSNASSIVWDFDDGNSSNKFFPDHNFPIGFYNVVATATNGVCNWEAKDTIPVSVDGIEYFTPDSAALIDGYGKMVLRVFGGGFSNATVVCISRGNEVVTTDTLFVKSSGEMTALFTVSGASAGQYDLEISLNNSTVFRFPNAITLYEEEERQALVTSLNGPSRLRTGRWVNYTLSVTNTSPALASAAVVYIGVPDGVETNLHEIIQTPEGVFTLDENRFKDLQIDANDFSAVYFDGTFDPKTDTFSVNFNSDTSESHNWISYSTDTLFDQPFKGEVYPMIIPVVTGNSTVNIQFKVRANNNGSRSLISFASPFNMRVNPISGAWLDFWHDLGMGAASLAAEAPNPALKAVGKSAAYVDIASQIIFLEGVDLINGQNNADSEFYSKQVMALGGEYAGGKIASKLNLRTPSQNAKNAKAAMNNVTKRTRFVKDLLNGIDLPPATRNALIEELAENKLIISQLNHLSQDQQIDAIGKVLEQVNAKGIDLTKKQLEEILFKKKENWKVNKPELINRKRTDARNSWDPNAIYGETGFTTNQYLNKNVPLNYMVTFENVDTAQLPAQIVNINVNLDPAIYDIGKTRIGEVGFGDQVYFLSDDRSSLFRDIDLRPAKNMLVRVMSRLDTATGDMTWKFIALNPTTLDLISDAFDGFLPPNVNAPEGEGFVTFTTFLKRNVPHDQVASCFATIVFDENPPIITNTWMNRVDDAHPSTTVNPTINVIQDTIMVLSFNSSDMGSQVEDYELWVQINNEWAKGGIPFNTKSNSIEIIGVYGFQYGFAVYAKDSVGLLENKPLIVEASTNLLVGTSVLPSGEKLTVFPNPASHEIRVHSTQQIDEARIKILDVTGKLLAEHRQSNWFGNSSPIDISSFPSGSYLIEIQIRGINTPITLQIVKKPK